MVDKVKKEKIFLNAMDSWFSNFLIETFRTDHLPESKLQTEFMGTINDQKRKCLPMYFEPKIFNFDFNTSYKSDIFSNDIIIYNLNTGSIKEADYIIRGLKSLNFDTEKILIIISNIFTWGKTPVKIKTDDPNEIVFIHPDDIKPEKPKEEIKEKEEENEENNEENNENLENNEQNKSNLDNKKDNKDNKDTKDNKNEKDKKDNKDEKNESKENDLNASKADKSKVTENLSKNLSKKNLDEVKEDEIEENKPILVYYTEKDYLKRKPSTKYIEYKYIENEALLLNKKNNIKAYIVCPGIIYGYGEQTFYSIFRSAILGFPVEELLLDKGRNIIPTIHMKDLITIITKIIEKKPSSYYLLAFDQSNNRSLNYIVKSIYDCAGDLNKMIIPKVEEPIEENEENKEEENKAENEEKKDATNNKNNDKNNDKKNNEDKNKTNNENNNEPNNNEQSEKEGNSEEKKNEELIPEKKVNPLFTDKKFILPKYFPRELLSLDLKILPSEFIKGEPKKSYYNDFNSDENKEEERIEYTPLFKWHAPGGIMSNSQSIRKEFTKYRNLNSNKILVLGNPYTGKTTLSTIISKVFHLPIINSEIFVEFGKKIANVGNNTEENNEEVNENNEFQGTGRRNSIERDLIRDIQKTIKELDENKAIAEENYNKRKDKKKTDPPFDDRMYYRFNDEMMVRMLKRRLQENDTSVYGFVLDGFPKTYQQAEELFEDYDKGGMVPNSVIIFENAEDDFLINRLKASESFPKDQKDPQATAILDRANRRLAKIKENKAQEDYKELIDFFKDEKYENIFKVLVLDPKKDILDLYKETQEFIINNNENKINQIDEMLNCNDYVYDYIKEEELRRQKEEELQKELENEKNKDKKGAEKDKDKNKKPEEGEKKKENEEIPEEKEEEKKEEEKEKEKEESKEEEKNEDVNNENKNENEIEEEKKEEEKPKTQYEIEKENEFRLLEKKSEVLRRYLAENVLPLLSLGILQVASERPDDPVEALADFLLSKTFDNENKDGEKKNNEDNKTKEDDKNNEDNKNKDEEKKIENNENKNEDKKDENINENDIKNIEPIEKQISQNDDIDFNINEAKEF